MASIHEVLGAENLLGMIQKIVNGVPADLLPQGMLTPTRNILGDTGYYYKVEGTRQTARAVAYGGPSVARDMKGVDRVPVKLLHTFEHQTHAAATLQQLMSMNGGEQQLGREEVARQLGVFGTLFRNLRISSVYSALAKGAVYFDGNGNLLPTSSGASLTIDYGVPAGHQSQLNVFGEGNILSANWDTAATDIGAQIKALKKAARKRTGYPIINAFYGENIPGYLAGNTKVANIIDGSPRLAEAAASAEIPNGLFGLNWFPISEAFFADADGTNQDWFAAKQVIFTPAPDPSWWQFYQGSYAIPTDINVTAGGLEALSNLQQVFGPFSYATMSVDPPGLTHYGGDTFLPILANPLAIYIATVPTS